MSGEAAEAAEGAAGATDIEPSRAALYLLRTGIWRVQPGVMTADAGTLTFASASEGEILRAPFAELKATFTLTGRLVIRHESQKHVFAMGGSVGGLGLTPAFSRTQLSELGDVGELYRSGRVREPGGQVTGVSANVAVPREPNADSAVHRIGVGRKGRKNEQVRAAALGQANSFQLMRAWVDHLRGRGLAVRMRGTTYARGQRIGSAVTWVSAFALFIALCWLLIPALASR